MSYAGVNAHHQNGIAERRIRELQELARTMLIHANARWNNSVTANLWPYAIQMANEAVNHMPSFQDREKRLPIELFTGSSVSSNPKHWKPEPFGCPTYVLDNELQGSKPFHKWQQRSKPGIYLGSLPLHGRNVALVLSRKTGLVSPQFHVAFDPAFDMVRTITTKSNWQVKAGFVIQKGLQEKKKVKATGSLPNKGALTRKRRRVEALEEQGTNRDQNERTIPLAAADVGDGSQPMPSPESETQREAQPGRPEQVTRFGRKTKLLPG